jgi:uncharacterized protein (DUF362 family)
VYECRFKRSFSVGHRDTALEKVAIVRCRESVSDAIGVGLDYTSGLADLKGPVLIKPNICTISDDTGHSVTDAAVVDAVIDLLLATNNKLQIRIVESDSQSKQTDSAFSKFGYEKIARDRQKNGFDVELINLSGPPLREVEVSGLYFKTLKLHESLIEPHFYISVPVAKTHQTAFLTCAMKNQFGLLPKREKAMYHRDITKILVDINRAVAPDLCIVDGRVGIEGWNGPKTHDLGVFVIGKNPVAVDATVARVMGFKVEQVEYLSLANRHGLGTLDPDICGETIGSVSVEFKAPF